MLSDDSGLYDKLAKKDVIQIVLLLLLAVAALVAVITSSNALVTKAVAAPVTADITAKYNASCATCHQAGVLGAQKTGDTAAWTKALNKKGKAGLLNSVKNGYNNMPARGLCDDCSDADYQALIDYMMKGK